MATIKKSWATSSVIYSTGTYGGSDLIVTASNAINTGSVIDLESEGHEGVQIEIKFNDVSGSTGTDNLDVFIYATISGAMNVNLNPIFSQQFTNDGNENRETIIFKDVANIVVGLQPSGSTNGFAAEVQEQRWNWTSE